VAHPVRQAAALAELLRLQLLSPKSKDIVRVVLVRRDLLGAMTLDQFMGMATTEDLSQARCRLRNMRQQQKSQAYGAKEHLLNQQLVEREMADTLGVRGPNMDVFLTEGPELQGIASGNAASVPDANDASPEADVARSGDGIFAVKRVPTTGTTELYRVDRGSVDEIPFRGSLASFLHDPLDLVADEDSPLIQELRNIEACVGLGGSTRPTNTVMQTEPSRHRRGSRKPLAHRIDPHHCRALAFRQVPPPGIEPRPQMRSSRWHQSISDTMSEATTELSLRIAGPEDPLLEHSQSHSHKGVACSGCRLSVPEASKHSHFGSLAETTVGGEHMLEFSVATGSGAEDFSKELGSISQTDALAAGHSIMTAGSESLPMTTSISDKRLSAHYDLSSQQRSVESYLKPCVARRSALTAEVEVHQHFLHPDFEEDSIGVDGASPTRTRVQKRILHVTRAPYHDCVAFDKAEYERERESGGANVSWLMHPSTKQRFQELESAGKFPRRSVTGKTPHSARLPYRPTSSFDARRHFLRRNFASDVQEGSRTPSQQSPTSTAHTHAGSVAASPPLPDLRLPKVNAVAGGPGSLKTFFPASARNVRR